jgi:hypothetical protein
METKADNFIRKATRKKYRWNREDMRERPTMERWPKTTPPAQTDWLMEKILNKRNLYEA